MRHDQYWKTILRTFLREFMELFLPDEASGLDFSSVSDVERQLFTDLPEGRMREPDLALEVRSPEREAEVIVIHIEIQHRRGADVPRRMWEYYSLLRLRTRRRVLPLVLYLGRGAGGVTPETYVETLLGREILLFRYMTVGLGDLRAEEYLERDNVLSAPLSALMSGERATRVARKIRAYDKVRRSILDEARRSMLVHMIDRYLILSEEEEVEMSQKLREKEHVEVQEWLSDYEVRGIEKGIGQGIEQGIEQGIDRGLVQGKKETLLLLLRHRFGTVPEDLARRIEGIDSASELDALALKAVEAKAVADLGLN